MWKIIGQERSVAGLENALAGDRLPHALLLTGPAGVGKTRLARELAKALNCIGDHAPCQQCVHCLQIEGEVHPDVVLIERQDGKESIVIQQVRELRDSASLRPFQGRTKVYIIAGAESLTGQAADALLKTLEEPQPQVLIALTSVDVDGVPETVVSRCRHISLSPAPASVIVQALEEGGMEVEEAKTLARLAQGSPGWALSARQQPKLLSERQSLITRLGRVLDMSVAERLDLVESLAGEKRDRHAIRRHLELLVLLGRDVLLLAQGLPAQVVIDEDRQRLADQAARLRADQVCAHLRRLRVAMERIDQNVDPRLTLEAALLTSP